MDKSLTTTCFTLDGYKVVKNLGPVRGIVVRSRSVIGNFGASIQVFFGGNISVWASMCEKAREDAYEIMMSHAELLGANAILGFRYDATDVSQGVTEVLAYGTACIVEKI